MNPGDSSAENLVCIGVGVRAHGVRGEVRVTSLSELAGRFAKGLEVVWRRHDYPNRSLIISAVRGSEPKVLLRFAEIADRNQAEALNGGKLWCVGESPDLIDDDTFYHHELLGMSVTDSDGRVLGRLTAVLETGAHDNYEITPEGGKAFLVPAVLEFIEAVDVDARQMVIRPIPGLIPESAAKPDDSAPAEGDQ